MHQPTDSATATGASPSPITTWNTTPYGREGLTSRRFGPHVTVHLLHTITADGIEHAPCEVEVSGLSERFLSADDARDLAQQLAAAHEYAARRDHAHA